MPFRRYHLRNTRVPFSQAVSASLRAFSPDRFRSGHPIGSGRKCPLLPDFDSGVQPFDTPHMLCHMCEYYHPQLVHPQDESSRARKKVFLED
jgi:hypothetical protein